MEQERIKAYESDWGEYAYQEEPSPFLSSSEEDLKKICDVIDLESGQCEKTAGGIPIHYDRENKRLYTLKEGHARVSGETGSMKSRTVSRGQIYSCVKNRDSFIATDPKGELCEDAKIIAQLEGAGFEVYVMDFRNKDKDGFNVFSYAYEKFQAGEVNKAMSSIDRFVKMLKIGKRGGDDPYWNDNAGSMIRSIAQFLFFYLSSLQYGAEAFQLASIKSFIRQDREQLLQRLAEQLLKRSKPEHPAYSAVNTYNEMLQLPDKTYACVISSAISLIDDFCTSDELLRMLSLSTFEVKNFYERPCALFIVVPDETKAYDMLVGYLIDTFYEILVEVFSERYQGKKKPSCRIHMICDEIASIFVNDMASKISASRSREIEWTLIYQSDKQMQQAYPEDFGTIVGNCRNMIFLGSSDYEILCSVSEQVGKRFCAQGRRTPLVSVADLRRMKKEWTYKDALVVSGPYLYCARLSDYEQYPFRQADQTSVQWQSRSLDGELVVYTPEKLYQDVQEMKLKLTSDKEQQTPRRTQQAPLLSRQQRQTELRRNTPTMQFDNDFSWVKMLAESEDEEEE